MGNLNKKKIVNYCGNKIEGFVGKLIQGGVLLCIYEVRKNVC